jgi:uncharacterized protein with HEPN domain
MLEHQEQATAHQTDWDDVRNLRAQLILGSDWTQLPDSPLQGNATLNKAWKDFRQQLRDITKETNPKVAWDKLNQMRDNQPK